MFSVIKVGHLHREVVNHMSGENVEKIFLKSKVSCKGFYSSDIFI